MEITVIMREITSKMMEVNQKSENRGEKSPGNLSDCFDPALKENTNSSFKRGGSTLKTEKKDRNRGEPGKTG